MVLMHRGAQGQALHWLVSVSSHRSVRLPYVLTGDTRAHLTFKDERAPLVTRETMQTGQACRGVPNPALRLTRSKLGEAFSHLILAQLTVMPVV